jgi:hypothetical protein
MQCGASALPEHYGDFLPLTSGAMSPLVRVPLAESRPSSPRSPGIFPLRSIGPDRSRNRGLTFHGAPRLIHRGHAFYAPTYNGTSSTSFHRGPPDPPNSGASTRFDCVSYLFRSTQYRFLTLMDPGRGLTPSRSNQMQNQSITRSKISRRFSLFDCGAYDSLEFKLLPAVSCPYRPHRHASIYSRGHGTSRPRNSTSLR